MQDYQGNGGTFAQLHVGFLEDDNAFFRAFQDIDVSQILPERQLLQDVQVADILETALVTPGVTGDIDKDEALNTCIRYGLLHAVEDPTSADQHRYIFTTEVHRRWDVSRRILGIRLTSWFIGSAHTVSAVPFHVPLSRFIRPLKAFVLQLFVGFNGPH